MKISERYVGEVTVVDVAGRLTLTDGPGVVKGVISSLVARGRRQIVLNLAAVPYIDSSGLGELVACHHTATRAGGVIKLANAGPRVLELLVLTKLLTVFESHESEQAAILSFGGPRSEVGCAQLEFLSGSRRLHGDLGTESGRHHSR